MFTIEAVKDFIQGRSSYAVIKARKDVSVGTLSSWVHTFGNACMNPVEIARRLNLHSKNRWSGILLLDGKYIRKNCYLLLAVDYQTLDIVAHLVCDSESEDNYTKLIDLVEACSYRISALISDGHVAITSLTTPKKLPFRKGGRNYPRPGIKPAKKPEVRLEGTPHQWCVVHAQRELEQLIGKLERRDEQKYQETERASLRYSLCQNTKSCQQEKRPSCYQVA